ncbi:uroporphyrinogen-III C-methyltransferase [Pedomonas mirosovicensis]|uniref:uroporphyrinogen-III C-methyltransferase n=1 Tax=Pedomonas mirosovicensis TaxID=2908641 RepID=UPI00216835E9|nr:uroporphyrinogen-III C-methyltransferase [Pedomonas mirosovicensis]MCH8686643.1 uroporphyrinogen-III C-methyltransferase [Pedomonas mirosovicensis]
MPSDLHIVPGDVWLVGAGPGDPELLTLKAIRLIEAADVVFHDALVSAEILALVPKHVRVRSVGKRSGRHSREQGDINDDLLSAARAGLRVVRLKGGDPSIFGRSAEEMAHLRAHGISVHVVPGITAASAAAASAGVSLTLRGAARRLQFITAHAKAGEALDLDWAALADPRSTLAIYMGRAAAPEVARNLLSAGLPPATPALIVENASLASERRFSTRLDLLALAVKTAVGDGPTLLLIGAALKSAATPGCMPGLMAGAVPSSSGNEDVIGTQ